MRLLVTHPAHWARRPQPKGVKVRHVELGAPVPRRMNGQVSYDGIGQVVTDEGIAELYRQAREWKPDVFLFGIHMKFHRPTLERFRMMSPKTLVMMHYTDQRPSVSKFVKEHVGLIDVLLVTNNDDEDHAMYRRIGIRNVRTFYDGVDPAEYWPKPAKEKYEVFFGGNNFWQLHQQMQRTNNNTAPWIRKFSGAHLRDQLLEEVDRHFRLVVRGEWGWEESDLNVKPPLFHPHYLDAMREGTVILSTVNMPKQGLVTRRMYRSIASGRLYVTEYSPGMEEHFENHKHLVWYRTQSEAIDLIRYYLNSPGERERIAVAGRELVVERDTFARRLHEFVELVKGISRW